MLDKILIISKYKTRIVDCKNVDKEEVGQKTLGLLEIPSAWRLPFFVISKNDVLLYVKESDEERKEHIRLLSHRIRKEICKWKHSKIIVRSSGSEEGMEERGKYRSEDCDKNDIDDTLAELFCDFVNDSDLEPIAFVVQPFVDRKEYGHLSNERFVSKDRRDWVLEYHEKHNEEPIIRRLSVRKWRTRFEEAEKEALCFDENNDLIEQLRKVIYYYYKDIQRVHLEFVADKKRLYLVQRDVELEREDAVAPYSVMNQRGSLPVLKTMRDVNEKDAKYSKTRNHLLYKSLGLTKAKIYVFKNRNTINRVINGEYDLELYEDLKQLVQGALVIRTDMVGNNLEDVQFLPRSNELRTVEDVQAWFKKSYSMFIEMKRPIFLMHQFIPSVSSAFAYATPNSRVVTINALWGLPEGLYYNPYDSVVVDTGTLDVEHINEQEIMITKKKEGYKGRFVSPADDGSWVQKRTQKPYDWKMAIDDDQIRHVAYGSRLIACKENKTVSIMWFVGVDKDKYGFDCIPWYHEEYMGDAFEYEVYKKKYYSNSVVTISSEKDIENNLDNENIKAIQIHPKDDDTLRNRNFLLKVAKFAKQKNTTVFLEGTMLAHPVYTLQKEGIKVKLSAANVKYIERNNYNKLVRDKIPERILFNQEKIVCYKIAPEVFCRYLKEKLIEEVYEVNDAKSLSEYTEELVDVSDVVETFIQYIDKPRLNITRDRTKDNLNIRDTLCELDGVLLDNPEYWEEINAHDLYFYWCVQRISQSIEVEVKISHNRINRYIKGNQEVDKKSKNLMYYAYELLDEKDMSREKELSQKILENIDCGRKDANIDDEQWARLKKEKREKRGRFDERYALEETKIDTAGYDEEDVQFDVPNNAMLYSLLSQETKYMDYRNINGGEIIIRYRFHLCAKRWSCDFSGDKLNSFLGVKDAKLILEMRREESMYYKFSVYLYKNDSRQLTIEDYL